MRPRFIRRWRAHRSASGLPAYGGRSDGFKPSVQPRQLGRPKTFYRCLLNIKQICAQKAIGKGRQHFGGSVVRG